jgi:hypothetical protein
MALGMMRRSFAVAMAVVGMLVLAGVGSASAAGQLIPFAYAIKGLPPGGNVQVIYDGGVLQGSGGSVQASSGAIQSLFLLNNAMLLFPSPGAPLSAQVTQYLSVGSHPVTGTAKFPDGTTVNVTNTFTRQTMALANGPFSLPTGVGALGAKPPTAGAQQVSCHGNGQACTARIDLAGGASNRTITIRLTDTDLRLESVKAYPTSSRDAYTLSDGRFKLSGSEYVTVLNAVESNPRGSYLILTFKASAG